MEEEGGCEELGEGEEDDVGAPTAPAPSLAKYETDLRNSPQSRARRAASAPEEAAARPSGVARPAPHETSVSRSHRKRETSRDQSGEDDDANDGDDASF